MNRAERRRSARQQEKPKTYVLTEDQINKMKMDAVNIFGIKLWRYDETIDLQGLQGAAAVSECRNACECAWDLTVIVLRTHARGRLPGDLHRETYGGGKIKIHRVGGVAHSGR